MTSRHDHFRPVVPTAGQLKQGAFRALLLLLAGCASAPRAELPAFRNPALPIETRVHDLLGRMTPDEKFWQLYMAPGDLAGDTTLLSHGIFGLQIREHAGGAGDPAATARRVAARINEIQHFFVDRTRLGIPIIPFEEAEHGLLNPGATMFPQAIALAASWDTSLMDSVATAIASEARTRGIRQVLSPVVNVASDVRWGRVEETYGEDPLLSSAMAVAFVSPFERSGVVTTPKHFVANVGDGGRDSYPIDVDERLLEEEYFPPFKAALQQGGARTVMASYNSVDGVPASASRRLLTETLRDQWGFTGVVISDEEAVGGMQVLHFTSPDGAVSAKRAIEAGLDVIFDSDVRHYAGAWHAFQRGMIDPAAIDRAAARVLRLKFELGLFENPYAVPGAAAAAAWSPSHHAIAREAARASLVLLKNDDAALPLSKSIRSLAVIGVDADEARLGGYSGPGIATVSILQGIRSKLGAGTDVRYAPGPGRLAREYIAVPSDDLVADVAGYQVHGLAAEYFDNPRLEGTPRVTRTDAQVDFAWTLNAPARGIPFDWYSVRWTGRLVAPASGTVRLGVEGNDGYRLWLDGKLLIDDWQKRSYGSVLKDVQLERGREYDLRLEYFESTGNARVKLVWSHGVADDWRSRIDSAVRVAAANDAAVIVVGVEEGEFRDRSSLALPGHQEELIRAVAATGKPVVVVLIGGSAVTMNGWLDRVGAVVDAWYPGEAGGDAVADVLFGDYNPAGRLPITFPMREGQLPLMYNHKPTGRGDDYVDGTGQPLFPFGFGLSYTTFSYSDLRIEPATVAPNATVTVRCTVRNDGPVGGDEVVQLYLRDELASVVRPVMQLADFRRVHLARGESKEMAFRLGSDELGMLDERLRHVVEPGTFRVMIGASSKDIRLRGRLVVR